MRRPRRMAQASHTVPTGLPGTAPPAPAMPDTATAACAAVRLSAPRRHGPNHRLADRAMPLQQRARHSQPPNLGLIAIGNESLHEPLRTAAIFGERLGNPAAGAGLSRRNPAVIAQKPPADACGEPCKIVVGVCRAARRVTSEPRPCQVILVDRRQTGSPGLAHDAAQFARENVDHQPPPPADRRPPDPNPGGARCPPAVAPRASALNTSECRVECLRR